MQVDPHFKGSTACMEIQPSLHRNLILHPFLRSNLRDAFDLSLRRPVQQDRSKLRFQHISNGGEARSNQNSGLQDPGGIQMWLEVHFCIAILRTLHRFLAELRVRSLYIHHGYSLFISNLSYTCMYVYGYIYMYMCTSFVYIYTYIYTYICVCASMYVCNVM